MIDFFLCCTALGEPVAGQRRGWQASHGELKPVLLLLMLLLLLLGATRSTDADTTCMLPCLAVPRTLDQGCRYTRCCSTHHSQLGFSAIAIATHKRHGRLRRLNQHHPRTARSLNRDAHAYFGKKGLSNDRALCEGHVGVLVRIRMGCVAVEAA